MLGAEGVKTLVIQRLMTVLPKALEVRRYKVGCDASELPDVRMFVPSPVLNAQVGQWPAITVSVDDTPGELSNRALGDADDTGVIQHYQLEYNVLIGINTWSSDPEAGGALAARLMAERIALACREALLQNPWMVAGRGDYDDKALINYDRWIEEYGSAPGADEVNAEGWVGTAALRVPVLATEFLDRAPYMDTGWYVLAQVDRWQTDPVTGAVMPETAREVLPGDTGLQPPTTP